MKDKVIAFIDALMVLFEDKNRLLYKHLIQYHHRVKNVMDDDELTDIATSFLSDSVRERIERRDARFLFNTELETDADLIWESCTSENRVIIWKWIDSIMRDI